MNFPPNTIPSRADWGGIEGDLDALDAYKSFGGRSNGDMQKLLAENVLARAQDLRFMPSVPFTYYMRGFCDFVRGGKFGDSHPAEVADAFLSVAKSRVESDLAAVVPISKEIELALAQIASKQLEYEAESDIFGNFAERAAEVRCALGNKSA